MTRALRANFERQHSLVGKEDIAFETAAFVLGADQVDEPGDLDMLVAGNEGPHRHDIVELKMRVRIDGDPPLERRRTFGAEHHADGATVLVSHCRSTARTRSPA